MQRTPYAYTPSRASESIHVPLCTRVQAADSRRRRGSRSRLIAAAVFLVVLSTAHGAGANEQAYGLVHADQPTAAAYTADPARSHNDAGGGVEISRTAPGAYTVRFEGLGALPGAGGHVQVSAYGASGGHCKVLDWMPEEVRVRCFDASGSAADRAFDLLYLRPDLVEDQFGYAWADQPTSPTYAPSSHYAYNDGNNRPVEVVRSGTGEYVVTFTGFGAEGSGGGHAQVTAYGGGNARCQVAYWGSDDVGVDCFDPAGVPTDSPFDVLLWRPDPSDSGVAFAWADDPFSSSYAPAPNYAFNPTGAAVAAERIALGHYRVSWPGFDQVGIDEGAVFVSAYGAIERRCRVEGWTLDTTTVRCEDGSGSPADATFAVLFVKPTKTNWTPAHAFAWANRLTESVYDATNDPYADNPAAGAITITRTGLGAYTVDFEDYEYFGGGGNVQVSAVSGLGHFCSVRSWSGRTVTVDCYDNAGAPADTIFTVLYVKAPPGDTRVGYAWGQFPFMASYTPSTTYAHSPHGGEITIERLGVGSYEVRFADVFPDGGAPPVHNFQVSAYGSSTHCGLLYNYYTPATGGVGAAVNCYDALGIQEDTQFSILLTIPGPDDRSLAFAYDIPSFPVGYPGFNSGNGPISWASYPGAFAQTTFDGFVDAGTGLGIALATPTSGRGVRCAVADWAGDDVFTRCAQLDGTPSSAAVSVLYLKRNSVPEPALSLGLAVAAAAIACSYRKRRTHGGERRETPPFP